MGFGIVHGSMFGEGLIAIEMKGMRIWNFAFVLFNHALCLFILTISIEERRHKLWLDIFSSSYLICKLESARGREREVLHTVSFSQPKICQFSELASLNL